MKKRILFLYVFVLLIGGYFYNQKSKSDDINFESFNIVSPGVIRTPDERFKNLEDYNFKPNYIEINNLRIHYLDEGPKDGEVIYLLHGEPAWSYLFRKMIPILTEAGYRVIAPDMVGFGKSDKYISTSMYTHQMHVDTMKELIIKLDLKDITAHVHDWGGMVGLRVIAEEPDRFSRIIASNTGLPAMGRGFINDVKTFLAPLLFKFTIWLQGPLTWEEFIGGESFTGWIRYSKYTDNIDVGAIMEVMASVSDKVKRGYEAPYPNATYKAGAQIFPYLIPSEIRKNEMAFRNVFEQWKKPFLIANSSNDPVTGNNPGITIGLKRIPSAEEIVLYGPGHFVQEEAGPEYANLIIEFINGEAKSFTIKQTTIDREDIL